MTEKTSKKGVSQKRVKNEAQPGVAPDPKIYKKPTRENLKNHKIAQKTNFCASKFWQNFEAQKNAKKGGKKRTPGRPAECKVPAGGKEGCTKVLNPPRFCMTFCKSLHEV
jgi:hypothetical protein